MSLDVNISEPEEFNCIQLHDCIKDVAVIKGIHNFEYHVDYVCGKGDNYIANVFRVVIKETGDEESKVNVIVKTLVNTERQHLFRELHKREVIAYKYVISKYKILQNSLKDDDRLVLPECLYSSPEKDKEIIIFDDLKEIGYEMDDESAKYQVLEYEHICLILTELAKFHALSFVYERLDNNEFSQIITHFEDFIFHNNFLNKSKLRKYFFESFEMSLNVISDLDAKKNLEKIETKLLHILYKYTRPGKFNVLCHGDCWIKNMLYRYSYEMNKKTKICFLDFQAMRYATPVIDILYFLYLSTDSDFRSKYLLQLQSVYFDSLKSFLNLYDIDVNLVYPKAEYENDFKEYLPYGLIMALIELRIVTTTPEDEAILKGSNVIPSSDLDYALNVESNAKVPGEIHLFKVRVNDVIRESIENGVLEKLLNL